MNNKEEKEDVFETIEKYENFELVTDGKKCFLISPIVESSEYREYLTNKMAHIKIEYEEMQITENGLTAWHNVEKVEISEDIDEDDFSNAISKAFEKSLSYTIYKMRGYFEDLTLRKLVGDLGELLATIELKKCYKSISYNAESRELDFVCDNESIEVKSTKKSNFNVVVKTDQNDKQPDKFVFVQLNMNGSIPLLEEIELNKDKFDANTYSIFISRYEGIASQINKLKLDIEKSKIIITESKKILEYQSKFMTTAKMYDFVVTKNFIIDVKKLMDVEE